MDRIGFCRKGGFLFTLSVLPKNVTNKCPEKETYHNTERNIKKRKKNINMVMCNIMKEL